MVKDHSDGKKRIPLNPHGLRFRLAARVMQVSFRQDSTYHGFCYTSCESTGWNKEGKEMFYLTTHSTHFIYGYMASDIR